MEFVSVQVLWQRPDQLVYVEVANMLVSIIHHALFHAQYGPTLATAPVCAIRHMYQLGMLVYVAMDKFLTFLVQPALLHVPIMPPTSMVNANALLLFKLREAIVYVPQTL